MKIRFLGTGTSQGVPMIGCDCAVCRSDDPRNRRCRTHIYVEMGGLGILVDAAPEFRIQALAYEIRTVDLALLTHGHADHVLGFDDLRRYCDQRGGDALPIYTNEEGLERLQAIYPYAMRARPLVRGYPAFQVAIMPPTLELGQAGRIHSTRQSHGSFETLGLVFEENATGARFAYFTDCDSVSDEACALAHGANLAVLDGLRRQPHPSHMNVESAIAAAQRVQAERSLLIHMTHDLDHASLEAELPSSIGLAYDGLLIELASAPAFRSGSGRFHE